MTKNPINRRQHSGRGRQQFRLTAETLEGRLMLSGETANPFLLDRGDFNDDGRLDALDIDLLSAEVRQASNDTSFDANRDGTVSQTDRQYWVQTLRKSAFGDATLDGLVNNGDLVQVLQRGLYEDATPNNANWGDGDWDGSGSFDKGDLVVALQSGRFGQSLEPLTVSEGHLAEAFDTGVIGELETSFAAIKLEGTSEPFSTVSVGDQTIHTDVDGAFETNEINLAVGENSLTVETSNINGQSVSHTVVITRVADDQSSLQIIDATAVAVSGQK